MTETIDKDLIRRWVAALRSGEYKQGIGSLRPSDDTFCCLGVLCDLIDNTRWDGHYYEGSSLEVSVLPPEYVQRAGLLTNHGLLPKPSTQIPRPFTGVLSDLNDSGYSFDEIADIIEEALLND